MTSSKARASQSDAQGGISSVPEQDDGRDPKNHDEKSAGLLVKNAPKTPVLTTAPSSTPQSKTIQVIPKLVTQSARSTAANASSLDGKSRRNLPNNSGSSINSHHSFASPFTSEEFKNITYSRGLGRFTNDPFSFMIRLTAEGSAFFLGSGWRNYHNYIGAKILYEGYTEDILSGVRKSPIIHEAVKELVEKKVKNGESEAEAYKSAYSQLESLASTMMATLTSRSTLRFTAFVVNNLLVRLYHQGIYIKGTEFLALREAAQSASERGISMIFLPCHKSHVDYLVISYIFYRLGIALPHIAAGQNLNIPLVGRWLRKGGAFFIRRTFGGDDMYNAVFRAYLEELMLKGHNIEAFIEGTRSRTGKLLTPKFGFLKIILEAVMSGRVKDVMICPMSIGYDKVIETESYVNELLGRPKEPESLGQLVNSTSVLRLKWGRIDVRFQKPWSLREFLDSERAQRAIMSDSSNSVLLRAMGYRILSDINHVAVTMPTALVGSIILTLRGRGVARKDLVTRVEWLRAQILQKGGKVAEFGDSTETILDRVLGILGSDLIGERLDLLEPVYFVKKRFELSFYRNQIIHLFIAEAILCSALEVGLRNGEQVTHENTLQDVSFLSQLLKREFIFPLGGVSEVMNRTLASLVSNGVLSSINNIQDRVKFDFYCFLIWPFVETYWLSSIALFMLVPQADQSDNPASNGDLDRMSKDHTWYPEKEFINQVQDLAKTLYYEGELTYFESINKEILRNAWVSFQEAGMLLMRGSNVAIHPDWNPQQNDRLKHKVRYIQRFRRDKDGVARYSPSMTARLQRLVTLSATRLANSAAATSSTHTRKVKL